MPRLKMAEQKKDKGKLSLFIVITITLILIATGYILQPFLRVGIQALLLLLQVVIVKNILDDYYKHIY